MPENTLTETRGLPPAKPWPLGLFSGNALKYIMAALMVLDHIKEMFPGAPIWLKILGRPVMPIFLFLCAEGFYHTRNRRRYLLQLLIGFEFMNVASMLLQRLLPVEGVVLANSAFGTMFVMALLLSFCSMIYRGIKEKKPGLAIGGVALGLAYFAASFGLLMLMDRLPQAFAFILILLPSFFMVEGGTLIFMGMLFYALRRWRWAQVLVLVAFTALTLYSDWKNGSGFGIQWYMIFAAIPMLLYNNKRGRGGKFSKYFFYIFYPAHIYLLYLLAYLVSHR
ncbi:MAG: conjugal transfer protein TraX [Oscillospiraceae bacterium]|jgi:hypothetical protein|nr:conjugal transfer protein TraX [Oscillospiraceae bacterium]